MRNLKRALSLALASVMVLGLMVVGTGASYADVTSEQNQEAIEVLQEVGIMVGDDNGNFNPENTVTRNEMAVVVSNLMDYRVATYAGTSPFTDVPSWAEPYVAACWTNGNIAGYSATIFGGSDPVTTSQAALMLMKALGYFQYQNDFAEDWQLATVSQANKIDLFDGVESGVREAMTRNDLAQLVLNTLEAGTVEPDDDTINVTTPDGTTVQAGKVAYNYITSDRAYATAISDLQTGTGAVSSNTEGAIVELGERLYNGDLKKDGSISDDFGRPATVWTYQSDEIGTYADSADSVWTSTVSERDLYNAAGSAAFNGYNWYVYRNGADVFSGADGADVLAYSRTSTERWQQTGNGVLTQMYVDSNEEEVVVIIIDTFVAEVTRVTDNGDDNTVTISYKSGRPSGAETTYVTDMDFAREDIVILTVGGGEIQSMAVAQTVEGTVSAVKNEDYVRIDGTNYNYNRAYTGTSGGRLGAGLVDLDESGYTNPDVDDEVVVYLDAYGHAVAVKGAETSVDDYLYIKGLDNAYGDVSAKVVFYDGTEATIDIDEIDNADATYSGGGYNVAENTICKWSTSGSAYDLESVNSVVLNDANIKRDRASVLNNYVSDISYSGSYTVNSNTVFVDVKNNQTWTGYNNVVSKSNVAGALVMDGSVAEIVFIADSSNSAADDEDYVYISGTGYETTTVDGDTVYIFRSAYVMGEKVDFYVGSRGARDAITSGGQGLYLVDEYSSKNADWATSLTRQFPISNQNVGASGTNYATYAKNSVITLANAAANLTGTQTSFSYNNDTLFVVAELKGNNNDTDSVYVGNVTDIVTADNNGDRDEYTTAVYVLTVEDDSDATPLAEMVLVIVPNEDATGGSGGGGNVSNAAKVAYTDAAAGNGTVTANFTLSGIADWVDTTQNVTIDAEVYVGNAYVGDFSGTMRANTSSQRLRDSVANVGSGDRVELRDITVTPDSVKVRYIDVDNGNRELSADAVKLGDGTAATTVLATSGSSDIDFALTSTDSSLATKVKYTTSGLSSDVATPVTVSASGVTTTISGKAAAGTGYVEVKITGLNSLVEAYSLTRPAPAALSTFGSYSGSNSGDTLTIVPNAGNANGNVYSGIARGANVTLTATLGGGAVTKAEKAVKVTLSNGTEFIFKNDGASTNATANVTVNSDLTLTVSKVEELDGPTVTAIAFADNLTVNGIADVGETITITFSEAVTAAPSLGTSGAVAVGAGVLAENGMSATYTISTVSTNTTDNLTLAAGSLISKANGTTGYQVGMKIVVTNDGSITANSLTIEAQ